MNVTSRKERKHAVVMGGSMAGLLATRVLAERFERITLVERDTLGRSPESRRGVPQGRHTHGLLAGGRRLLDELFPGISEELTAAGALDKDIVRDSRWFVEGACHCRFDSGLMGLLMSRPLLERAVRERVRALPNVRFRDNQTISGLAQSPDGSRVTGVMLGTETLPADLVVDATGRGSRSPQWLAAMGYAKPPEERVEVGLTYTTRLFRRRPGDLNGDVAAIIPPTPAGKVGGVALAQEDGRWTVTLLAHFNPGAPADLNGYIEFARALPAPYIYELIRHAEPLGEPVIMGFPASLRRRYEKLDRFPRGYLVMGDAVSSFNPIYGQGMSVAAQQAMELRSLLAEDGDDLAQRFFARAAKVIDIPWGIAVGNDLRMPETRGPSSFGGKLINAYMARVHRAAHRDPSVALAFHKVANLLAPPQSLMAPRVVLRVLRGNLRRRKAEVSFGKPPQAKAAELGHELSDYFRREQRDPHESPGSG